MSKSLLKGPQGVIPSRRQYEKWSLPTKWSFWAAVIGIPLGLVSLVIGTVPLFLPSSGDVERNRLLFQVSQELRYNNEWLSSLAVAHETRAARMTVGSLKTDALVALVQRDYEAVVRDAYGEEKHIYQHVLLLRDLGLKLGAPDSVADIFKFEAAI
jgi:hypothetical protein